MRVRQVDPLTIRDLALFEVRTDLSTGIIAIWPFAADGARIVPDGERYLTAAQASAVMTWAGDAFESAGVWRGTMLDNGREDDVLELLSFGVLPDVEPLSLILARALRLSARMDTDAFTLRDIETAIARATFEGSVGR